MAGLIAPDVSGDGKFLQRTIKTLLKGFKVSSGTQLNKAALCSVYLVAVGKLSDAIAMLESFVGDVEPVDGKRDVWGSAGEAVLLLAYLYNKLGRFDEESVLVSRIISDDIMSRDCSRAEYLADDLAEHQELMAYAVTETQKYTCEIIAQQILKFTYYYEMWSEFESEVHSSEKAVVETLIVDTYSALKNAIGN